MQLPEPKAPEVFIFRHGGNIKGFAGIQEDFVIVVVPYLAINLASIVPTERTKLIFFLPIRYSYGTKNQKSTFWFVSDYGEDDLIFSSLKLECAACDYSIGTCGG